VLPIASRARRQRIVSADEDDAIEGRLRRQFRPNGGCGRLDRRRRGIVEDQQRVRERDRIHDVLVVLGRQFVQRPLAGHEQKILQGTIVTKSDWRHRGVSLAVARIVGTQQRNRRLRPLVVGCDVAPFRAAGFLQPVRTVMHT
jgi:hypothetical protein